MTYFYVLNCLKENIAGTYSIYDSTFDLADNFSK